MSMIITAVVFIYSTQCSLDLNSDRCPYRCDPFNQIKVSKDIWVDSTIQCNRQRHVLLGMPTPTMLIQLRAN